MWKISQWKKSTVAMTLLIVFFLAPISFGFNSDYSNQKHQNITLNVSYNIAMAKVPLTDCSNWVTFLSQFCALSDLGGILLGAAGTDTAAYIGDATFGNLGKFIGWLIFSISTWMLGAAGALLDLTIKTSLNTSNFASAAVASGWTSVRDLVNMFFIFALLYIAIGTILQLEKVNTKKTLASLIVVGLLVNFSLFATKVVIDVSNVMASSFRLFLSILIVSKLSMIHLATWPATWRLRP